MMKDVLTLEEANACECTVFNFVRVLGSGRHGKVFEGVGKSGEKKALKVIKSACPTFDMESQFLDTLPKHPNIMRTESSFRLNDELSVFVMDVAERDLRSLILEKPSGLEENEAAAILAGLSSALSFLLDHSIFHRDLKPDNILLDKNEHGKLVVKLCDFGLAEKIDSSDQVFHATMGSGYYLAPEIWKRSGYTTKSDLYSCGAILYEMLCGKPPFYFAGDAVELGELAMHHSIPSDILPRTLSRNAKDLLIRLLRKRPTERIEWRDFFAHPFLEPWK